MIHRSTMRGLFASGFLGLSAVALSLSCSASEPSNGPASPSPAAAGAAGGPRPSGGGSLPVSGSGSGSGGSLMIGGVDPTMMTSPDPTEDENCGLVPYMLDQRPSPVLLLQDRSTSMRNGVDNGTGTRWQNLKTAVGQVVTATEAKVAWGMKFFPNETPCQVSGGAEFAPMFKSAQAIVGAINAIPGDSAGTGLTDGTPTRKVLEAATAYLNGLDATQYGNKYIVLATDGQPTCAGDNKNSDDYPAALAAAKAAAAAGIKIAVVGIAFDPVEPGETVDGQQKFLNDVAEAGGMARNDPADPQTRYYPAANTTELVAAFTAITSQVVSCTFTLPKVPPVPDNVLVKINDVKVPQDAANGWGYDPGMTSLTLRGSACTDALSKTSLDVKIVMGCLGQEVK